MQEQALWGKDRSKEREDAASWRARWVTIREDRNGWNYSPIPTTEIAVVDPHGLVYFFLHNGDGKGWLVAFRLTPSSSSLASVRERKLEDSVFVQDSNGDRRDVAS